MEKMRQRMVIENLSPRTITSYLNDPKRLIEYCNKPPGQINKEEIYAFLVYEREVKKHSRSTMHINVNDIRFLYKNFLKPGCLMGSKRAVSLAKQPCAGPCFKP
nr:phage integrase N-terminal SAM-like domain-containing protein [Bacteroidota bacterium]